MGSRGKSGTFFLVGKSLRLLAGKTLLLLAAGAILVGLLEAPALANDTAVGAVGGVVYPLASTDIRLEAETVQVICYRDFADYQIDFKFVNQGEPQTVQLGFPFVVTETDYMGTAPVGFRVWQDGRPVEVSLGVGVSQQDLITGNPPLGYYLHTVTFPRGHTMITVRYVSRPTVSSGSRFDEAAPPEFTAAGIGGWVASYDYWLHTGASWLGSIGKSVVRFYLADSFKGWGVDVPSTAEGAYPGNVTSPESYVKVDERTYQWIFTDFEPTEQDDIKLAFSEPVFFREPRELVIPASLGALGVLEAASADSATIAGQEPGAPAVEGEWTRAVWGSPAPGKGGWARFTILGNQEIKEIRIVPGRTDTLSSFGEYGRPKRLKVTLSDGTTRIVTLADEPSVQRFAVSGRAEWVRFDVLDIYAGTKSNETHVSLVDFGNATAPEFEPFATLIAEKAPPGEDQPNTRQGTSSVPSLPAGIGLSAGVLQEAGVEGGNNTGAAPEGTGAAPEGTGAVRMATLVAGILLAGAGVLLAMLVALHLRKLGGAADQ